MSRLTRAAPHESARHLLQLHIQSQLRLAGPREAVKLPHGASREMWIDIHIVDFVNEVATMWALVEQGCGARCGEAPMCAGARKVYDWDGEQLSAIAYVRRTLTTAKAAIKDDRLFPLDEAAAYPAPDFLEAAKSIVRRLVHVYAHTFHSHFSAIVALRCGAVVNDLFRRFVLFVLEFDLVDRHELDPLDELIRHLWPPARANNDAEAGQLPPPTTTPLPPPS